MQTSPRPVVFVCEHGAAKSVIAAAEFNAIAKARGVPVRAIARGTAPDDAFAPVVVDRLSREGVVLGGTAPTALAPSDLQGALRVVTFDQPQVESMIPSDVGQETWNGLPPVSADFDRARAAIRARVDALWADLERGKKFPVGDRPGPA